MTDINISALTEKGHTYLEKLCLGIPARRVGSNGNQAATAYFAEAIAEFGFQTVCPEFECLDWVNEGAQLTVGRESLAALVSPYSPGCQVSGPLAVVSTVEDLEAAELSHQIVLLRGELAREQLMPKKFPFYNPEHHQRLVSLLETKQPQAIIAATARNPELAGGRYPFPLVEDGDFDIPSVYMTDKEGEKLAGMAGREVSLKITARRIPSHAYNVIARTGTAPDRRVVVCAHIDAKDDTPGALDNAAGVVVLLLLAELLADYRGRLGVEIVALNGEDHYSAAGENHYLASNAARLSEIKLAVNIDAAGYRHGPTAYSRYGCPPEMATAVQRAFSANKSTVEGEPWYQSDHSIFIQQQIPAMAITSERLMELSTYITHTPQDSPGLVDVHKLVDVAQALKALLLDLDRLWL